MELCLFRNDKMTYVGIVVLVDFISEHVGDTAHGKLHVRLSGTEEYIAHGDI